MADVTERAYRVFRGFTNLDYKQRNEVLNVMREYQQNVDPKERKSLLESFATRAGVPVGPIDQGGCPCCGK